MSYEWYGVGGDPFEHGGGYICGDAGEKFHKEIIRTGEGETAIRQAFGLNSLKSPT